MYAGDDRDERFPRWTDRRSRGRPYRIVRRVSMSNERTFESDPSKVETTLSDIRVLKLSIYSLYDIYNTIYSFVFK